ncbi:MFS transporter [Streptomyces sp. DSM 44917]|uniref:MFS transporter n=1 Tax=Streptomyces boetiae TaxID=3075541 RepID=A0ABU2L4L3_9ACTN|nr:MFS transporter [Streptomyces sp. DSM 44917]MDT0306501.1 MFS transporter [Streptomyces sp. DSM 44917]
MTAPPNTPIPPRRRALMILLALATLVVVMDVTILNVALEETQRELGASNAGLQWALDSYTITFATLIFTTGVCIDRFGQRRTLIVGLVIFGVASVLAGYSGSIGELIAWRAVMGVGAAVIPTASLAIIMREFPPPERPRAIAMWASTGGISLVAGPLIGGLLLVEFWWGSVFLINAPLVLAGIVLAFVFVPESQPGRQARFEPVAVLLSIAAIGLLVYGVVVGGQDNEWASVEVWGSIVAGLALTAVLVSVERRRRTPSLDMGLFKSARFSAGTAVVSLAFFAFMGAIYVLTFYFQSVLGYSPLEAGLLTVPMGVGSLATAILAPRLTAAFTVRGVIAAGALGMAAAFVCFSLFGAETPLIALLAVLLLYGLGWGCIQAPATGALMSAVPLPKAGAGQAISQTLRQVGTALGIAVTGSVLGAVYRSSFGSERDRFPADLQDEAAGSIGGTHRALAEVHEQAGSGGVSDRLLALDRDAAAVVEHAADSYLSAMGVAMLLTAAIAVLAAAVAWRWLPKVLPPPGPPPAPPAQDGAPEKTRSMS